MSICWMNIDKRTKSCMLHSDVCRFSRGKRETPFKGIGTIKRDGGWMPFISIEKARTYYEETWLHQGYKFSLCAFCIEYMR